MNFSDLRALREALGLTQAELADEIGISRVYLGLMERGLRPISQRTAVALSRAHPKALPLATVETDPLLRRFENALISSGIEFDVRHIGDLEIAEYDIKSIDIPLLLGRHNRHDLAEKVKSLHRGIFVLGTPAIELLASLFESGGAQAQSLLAARVRNIRAAK